MHLCLLQDVAQEMRKEIITALNKKPTVNSRQSTVFAASGQCNGANNMQHVSIQLNMQKLLHAHTYKLYAANCILVYMCVCFLHVLSIVLIMRLDNGEEMLFRQ